MQGRERGDLVRADAVDVLVAVEVIPKTEEVLQAIEPDRAQVHDVGDVAVLVGPPGRGDGQQQVGHEGRHRKDDQRPHEVVVEPSLVDPQQEADGERQREMQEVEPLGDRGQVVGVRCRSRVEALEQRRRQRTQPHDPLQRDYVCNVDRQPELVGVASHQLVGEEERHERDPVAQEELAAAEQYGCQAEADDNDVGRDGDAPSDHQDGEQDRVGGDGYQKQPIVASTEMLVSGDSGLPRRPDGVRGGGGGVQRRFFVHSTSPAMRRRPR